MAGFTAKSWTPNWPDAPLTGRVEGNVKFWQGLLRGAILASRWLFGGAKPPSPGTGDSSPIVAGFDKMRAGKNAVETNSIHDCPCGLRYWRRMIPEEDRHEGAQYCECGVVLGAWAGRYRLVFEPEEERRDH